MVLLSSAKDSKGGYSASVPILTFPASWMSSGSWSCSVLRHCSWVGDLARRPRGRRRRPRCRSRSAAQPTAAAATGSQASSAGAGVAGASGSSVMGGPRAGVACVTPESPEVFFLSTLVSYSSWCFIADDVPAVTPRSRGTGRSGDDTSTRVARPSAAPRRRRTASAPSSRPRGWPGARPWPRSPLESGLTKGFLSKLERDQATASVASLMRLCQALGIQVGSLFHSSPGEVVRRATIPRSTSAASASRSSCSPRRASDGVQAILSEIEPGGGSGDELYGLPADVEFVFVIEGRLAVTLRDHAVVLEPGTRSRSRPATSTASAAPPRRDHPGAVGLRPCPADRQLTAETDGDDVTDAAPDHRAPRRPGRRLRGARGSPAPRPSPGCRGWTRSACATSRSSACRSTPASPTGPERGSDRRPSARRAGCSGPTTRAWTSSRSRPSRWPTPATSPATRSTSSRRVAAIEAGADDLLGRRRAARHDRRRPHHRAAAAPLGRAAGTARSRCCTSTRTWTPGTPTSGPLHPRDAVPPGARGGAARHRGAQPRRHPRSALRSEVTSSTTRGWASASSPRWT